MAKAKTEAEPKKVEATEARTMLAEICSWSIDGFDTGDLS
jgi:hypothetical protein